jgi:hypothetical protein
MAVRELEVEAGVDHSECLRSLMAIRDALDVLNVNGNFKSSLRFHRVSQSLRILKDRCARMEMIFESRSRSSRYKINNESADWTSK